MHRCSKMAVLIGVILNGQKHGVKNMIYGYARVSTFHQKKDGNSLDDQNTKLIAAGAQEIITDSYTGTKMERPEFSKLLSKLQEGDTLIVTKLDRFARTAIDGGGIIKSLHDRGITIDILNMGKADNTPMGNLMITILLAFAEFERDMIVERTQTGKDIARAKGIKVDGRPKKYTPAQMDHAVELLSTGNSYTHVEKITGISKSTLIREARARKQI
jgi:DNA invertase Pin-like site-specific DNA recombinase